ncbi:FGGY family carbohydrate kinase [Caenimonas sp. SL110]|uniref:FGGY family carbohydrate kinase n=1 Tax=Caenimonas sp. SL110 TaxID=1450524 RepID=UPI000654541E|nr:FGGY family carbohydrate kinase [Caenimonas sp. SL110]
MPELILALDIGTTSLSACVFTPGGQLKASAFAPVHSWSKLPGHVEQDAAQLWASTLHVIQQALARAGIAPGDLAAIGVTSQRGSIVCWDRITSEPLGPVVVWSDLRGAPRATEYQKAGYPAHPHLVAVKLEVVLAGLDRANLAWGNVDSWIIWKLSGASLHVTDRSQAWAMGYIDGKTLDWNGPVIAGQAVDPKSFPALVDTWGVLGTTTIAVFGAEVPIAAVIGDQQSALIGHGCEAAGQMKVSYGTSATVNVSTGAAMKFISLAMPPHVLSSGSGRTQYCLEGMVLTAGAALDWLRQLFAIQDHEAFEALAAATPDAGGVVFLPALLGLGAPHGDFARRGLIGGLNSATTQGQIVRAAVEGLACRVREAVDAVRAGAGLPPCDLLKVDGGLTHSDSLMQAQADIMGLPVTRHALREAASAGAAICAARGVGLLGAAEVAGFATYDRTFEPRMSADEAAEKFAAWKAAAYS